MKIRLLTATAVSMATLALLSTSSFAAGFYIQEQSVKGLGTAFAGSTTSIDDASTIFFNPAGMTKLDGIQGNVGLHLLLPDADLENDGSSNLFGAPVGDDPGNPFDPSPVPNLFLASPLNADSSIWAGIGVTAPFGLGSDYGDDSFVRFDSTETELTTINVTTALAYTVNDLLSIGGGVDVQYADAKLESRLFAGTEGTSQLDGDDISIGYNVGLLYSPTPQTDIGLHYRSAISHTLDGRIIVEGSGLADVDIAGSADLDLPDIATFGVAHDINDRLRLMGQITWFGWGNFESIRALTDAGAEVSNIEQDYANTYAFAVGAEYALTPTWTVRGGYQFDQTPTNDEFRTSRTPDGDRQWFSAGATYQMNERMSFDLAATYIDVEEGTINVARNGGAATVAGNTDGSVGILAIGLNYKF